MAIKQPTVCDQRHNGVKWSIAKWIAGSMLVFMVVVWGTNKWFYDSYVYRIDDYEIRLRATEQSAAVTVVELRAIRAQLDRIETQLAARKVAASK